MWTRGQDKAQPGKFAYELFDANNKLIERVGGFATHFDADRAAEKAQRAATFPVNDLADEISLDDLRAELAGFA